MNWNIPSGSPVAVSACPESKPLSRHSPPPRVTRRPPTRTLFAYTSKRGSMTRSNPDRAERFRPPNPLFWTTPPHKSPDFLRDSDFFDFHFSFNSAGQGARILKLPTVPLTSAHSLCLSESLPLNALPGSNPRNSSFSS
jgi:hypothetical protein